MSYSEKEVTYKRMSRPNAYAKNIPKLDPTSSSNFSLFGEEISLLTQTQKGMGVDRRVDRGTNPPYFWNWVDRVCFVPPYFLKRICVSFCGCVYCNFCYNCHLAKTVNQSRAKSSLGLLWLIVSLCPYR